MSDGEPIPGTTPPEEVKQPSDKFFTKKEVAPSNPLLEKFAERASEKKIKPVEGGDWLTIDGVEHEWAGVERGSVPENTDEDNFDRRLDQVGTYYSNNSSVAYVDGEGRMHVGHSTHENWQALQEVGYRQGSIWVPFSNGEIPTDPDIRKQYLDMRESGRETNRKRTTEEHLKLYASEAEKKGVKQIEGGLWKMVDGIEYRYSREDTGKIEQNTDGYNMPVRRIEQVGAYDSNNGRVAFVDGEGHMWVGASTQQNFEALREAGYRSGGIWVPFSNGEMPTDRATYEELRDILKGKPAEQLEAERNARVDGVLGLRKDLFGENAVLPDRNELFAKVADRAEREYVRVDQLVEERLSPQTEEDNAGFERTVYAYQGRSFSFKGREELPVYDTLTSSNSRFLGEKPNWISDEDWESYQGQIEVTREQGAETNHFVTNKSLLGVVELAIELGSEDKSLPQVRENITNGVYTQRELDLLDALIATNYGGWSYSGVYKNENAEATVTLALLGDEEAQIAVAESVETMRKADEARRVYSEGTSTEYEPLNPNELVVVHATRYEPKVDEEGNLLVTTSYDATNGKFLRNTVHTALNHKVAGHMYGSWGDTGYVLISPFNSMVEKNGLPRTLNTVDTYWTANPGETIVFADATIVAPGGEDVEGLYEKVEGENKVKFRSEGIDIAQLRDLDGYYKQVGRSGSFAHDVERSVFDAFERWGTGSELQEVWDYDEAMKAINLHLYDDELAYNKVPAIMREITRETGEYSQTIQDRLSELLVRSNAVKAIKPEVQDRDEAVRQLAEAMANRVKTLTFQRINEIAVNETIADMGYDIKPGGMWAWGDSWEATGRTEALGIEMDVLVSAHTDTVDSKLSERIARTINGAYSGEGEANSFQWDQYNPQFDELIGKLDPKSRRAMYASGLLVSRG